MALPEEFNPQRMEIARMRRMLGRRDLAKRIGVKPQTVSRWCHSLSVPSTKQVRVLAAVLEWPIGFFYGPDLPFPDDQYVSFRNITAL